MFGRSVLQCMEHRSFDIGVEIDLKSTFWRAIGPDKRNILLADIRRAPEQLSDGRRFLAYQGARLNGGYIFQLLDFTRLVRWLFIGAPFVKGGWDCLIC
jgi:hypothetical protein